MDRGAWGHKESDKTEQLTLTHMPMSRDSEGEFRIFPLFNSQNIEDRDEASSISNEIQDIGS